MVHGRFLWFSVILSLLCSSYVSAMNQLSFPNPERFDERENAFNVKSTTNSMHFIMGKLDGSGPRVEEFNKKLQFYASLDKAYPAQLQYHQEFVDIINFFLQKMNESPNDKTLVSMAFYSFFMIHLAYGFSVYVVNLNKSFVEPVLETCYSLIDYLNNREKQKGFFLSLFLKFIPQNHKNIIDENIISNFSIVLNWYNNNKYLKNNMSCQEFITGISLHEKIHDKEYISIFDFFKKKLLALLKEEIKETSQETISDKPISFIIKGALKKCNISSSFDYKETNADEDLARAIQESLKDSGIVEKQIEEKIEDKENRPISKIFDTKVFNFFSEDLGSLISKLLPKNSKESAIELEDCLKKDFIEGEALVGDNQWHCSSCNTNVNATKCYSLKTFPDNLFISLKRFSYKMINNNFIDTKISRPVIIPMNLDLSSYASNNKNSNQKYELQSFIVHSGYSRHSGHYYAYVKAGNTWYCYNDETVTVKKLDEIKSICLGEENSGAQPYILFYKKLVSNIHVMGDTFPNKGLENLGNTCFFNALIQCLSQNKDFVQWLKKGVKGINNGDKLEDSDKKLMGEFIDSFSKTADLLSDKNNNETFVSPKELRNTLIDKKIINSSGQQDPFEVFNNIIRVFWPAGKTDKKDDLYDFTFKYELETKVKGSSCGHESITYDPAATIQVSIPSDTKLQKVPQEQSLHNKENEKKRKRDETEEIIEIDEGTYKTSNKKQVIEQKSTIKQFKSINQNTYETTYDHVKNLCGLFAAYNGSHMLKAIENKKEVNEEISALKNSDMFTGFLFDHVETIEKNHKRKNSSIAGDFNTGEIVEILERQKIDNQSVVLETDDLEYFTANDTNKILTGFLKNKKLASFIKDYRKCKKPCLVIYNMCCHWIAIVISHQSIFIADSLESDRSDFCNSLYGNKILALFNTVEIPEEQKLEKYRLEETVARKPEKGEKKSEFGGIIPD